MTAPFGIQVTETASRGPRDDWGLDDSVLAAFYRLPATHEKLTFVARYHALREEIKVFVVSERKRQIAELEIKHDELYQLCREAEDQFREAARAANETRSLHSFLETFEIDQAAKQVSESQPRSEFPTVEERQRHEAAKAKLEEAKRKFTDRQRSLEQHLLQLEGARLAAEEKLRNTKNQLHLVQRQIEDLKQEV